MKNCRKLILCIFVLSCTTRNISDPNGRLKGDILIKAIHIVDIENNRINSNQDILITGNRIKNISSNQSKFSASQIINGKGKFIIPGLWDMHSHPLSERDLLLMVINGVTGTRIMDGDTNTLRWKQHVEEGRIAGPVIYTSGETFEGTPEEKYKELVGSLEGWEVVDSRLAAKAAVRRHKSMGYDFIKIYNNLKDSVVEAIFEESKRLNLDVCGHIPIETGLRKSIQLGIKSIEHLRGYIDEIVADDSPLKPGYDFKSRTLAWNNIDTSKVNEVIDLTVNSGVWNCPTFTFELIANPRNDIQAYLASAEAAYLIEKDLKYYNEREKLPYLSNFSQEDFNNTIPSLNNRYAFLQRLHRKGGLILAGSDADVYGLSLHRELQNLSACGLSNYEVLKTATINAARYFNIQSDYGTIDVKKIADLVILNDNPIKDIRATMSIHAVINNGKLISKKEIDTEKKKLTIKSNNNQYKLRR